LVRSNKKRKPGTEPKGILLNTFKPKTVNQSKYVESIDENIITTCTGPAGTGKTLLAISKACEMLANGQVDKIIVCRSIIGCGKEIGILPGDVDQKIHAYMIPALSYFQTCLDYSVVIQKIKDEIIQLLPVELIRGHTYDKSFIILEEAQNCDVTQLKLFMSRIGKGSKMVIIGDEKQSDIGKYSCMPFLLSRFHDVSNFGLVKLGREDILRHPIIQEILDVFDKYESEITKK